jgi:hypothetical protein
MKNIFSTPKRMSESERERAPPSARRTPPSSALDTGPSSPPHSTPAPPSSCQHLSTTAQPERSCVLPSVCFPSGGGRDARLAPVQPILLERLLLGPWPAPRRHHPLLRLWRGRGKAPKIRTSALAGGAGWFLPAWSLFIHGRCVSRRWVWLIPVSCKRWVAAGYPL